MANLYLSANVRQRVSFAGMGTKSKRSDPADGATLLAELDKYIAALAGFEARLTDALGSVQEATLRLVVKTDRGRLVSVRLETNEDLLATDQTATAAV